MKLYDGLIYAGKPDLGLTVIPHINEKDLYPNRVVTPYLPPKSLVQERAAAVTSPLVMVDVEQWPTPAGVWNYTAIAEWFKAALPSTSKFGLYAIPPLNDYWRAIAAPTDPKYISWVADNTLMQPLADVVDVLFPSLYTFYADRAGWKLRADNSINEAKRLSKGKPVIPYIWMRYHPGTAALQNKYIPSSYWRMQLDYFKEKQTDVVMWGGFTETWDDNACWWMETQDFLAP